MSPSVVAEQRGPWRSRGWLVARRAAGAVALALLVACCSGAPVPAATATPLAITAEPATPTPSQVPASDTPPPPTPAAIDPCGLITHDEANALAGVTVQDPEPAGEPPVRCVWATPVTGAIGQVEIDVGDGAKKAYDIDATVLGHTFAPVADVGDEAYAEDGAIFFRTSDTWVAIRVIRLDDPARSSGPLEQLARVVVGRI